MSSVGNATATGLVQNSVEKKKRIFRWGLNRGGHSAPKSGTKLWIAVAVLICAGTVHAQTVRASKPKPLIGVSPTSACRALDKQMPHYMLVSSDDFAETVLLSKLRKCLSGSSVHLSQAERHLIAADIEWLESRERLRESLLDSVRALDAAPR